MMKKHRRIILLTSALSLLIASLGISVGSTSIPFSHVIFYVFAHLPIVGHWSPHNWTETEGVILWQIRIPRTLLGFIVGGALSVAGVAYQGVLRNPLADPYTLGVSTGASVGAASMILFGIGGSSLSLLAIPLAAFVGACFALWVVLRIGRVGWAIRTETLILAGVVVNAFFGAILTLVLWLTPANTSQQIIWWMIGSLSLRDWNHAWFVFPMFLLAWAVIIFYSRDLNALALGDEEAESLGVRVNSTKWILLIVGSMAAASAVSVTGIIGFVGLVVPHVIRLITGPDHRILVICSGFFGGVFVVACDILARIVLAPVELSIGVVTALLGAPFFAYLLRAHR